MLVRCIARRKAGNRGPRKRRVVIPALEVIAVTRCGGERDICIQHRITCHGIRIGRRVSRRRRIVQRVSHRKAVCAAPLCIEGLCNSIRRGKGADRRTCETRVVIPTEEGITVSERG